MRHGHSSRPAGAAWVGRAAWEAGDARTAADQREAWQVEQHGAAEAWCAAVMAGAVEGGKPRSAGISPAAMATSRCASAKRVIESASRST